MKRTPPPRRDRGIQPLATQQLRAVAGGFTSSEHTTTSNKGKASDEALDRLSPAL